MTKAAPPQTNAWLLLDGAAAALIRLGLQPDVVVGDMDSLPPELAQTLAPERLMRCDGQSDSDVDKALRALFTNGSPADLLYVTGALGGRVDHMLANLAALARYAHHTQIVVLDPTCRIWFVTGRVTLDCEPDDVISLLAYPAAAKVSISSVKWPLDHARLEPGTLGVSNRAMANRVIVTAHSDLVLCIHQRQVTEAYL